MTRPAVHLATVPAAKPKRAEEVPATTNPCKLCAPLGASLALRGVRGAIPVLHGSQGCATYIRRYLISHYREPVDIASSSFGEKATIFGGEDNLVAALDNVIGQYSPELVGVATTCLAETIGEDVSMHLGSYRRSRANKELPAIIHVSTPAYAGTQSEGYAETVRALVSQLALEAGSERTKEASVNVLPSMVSPEDLRHLRDIVAAFGIRCTLLPDYSETLDGGDWEEYQLLSPGGTPVEEIAAMGQARASIEFVGAPVSAGSWLEEARGVPLYRIGLPIGVARSDLLMQTLEQVSGRDTPYRYRRERGRLVDALIDGHKHVFGVRVAIFGEPELVLGLASYLCEMGMVPVVCATGSAKKGFSRELESVVGEHQAEVEILDDTDFDRIEASAKKQGAQLLLGSSKGLEMSRALELPLVRVGFPIHDRFGAARVEHVGYRGALQLFDRIVNALLAAKQARHSAGYTYL